MLGFIDKNSAKSGPLCGMSGAGVGTRTHSRIVVMNNKPTWVIGLAQKGMGKGWTP